MRGVFSKEESKVGSLETGCSDHDLPCELLASGRFLNPPHSPHHSRSTPLCFLPLCIRGHRGPQPTPQDCAEGQVRLHTLERSPQMSSDGGEVRGGGDDCGIHPSWLRAWPVTSSPASLSLPQKAHLTLTLLIQRLVILGSSETFFVTTSLAQQEFTVHRQKLFKTSPPKQTQSYESQCGDLLSWALRHPPHQVVCPLYPWVSHPQIPGACCVHSTTPSAPAVHTGGAQWAQYQRGSHRPAMILTEACLLG